MNPFYVLTQAICKIISSCAWVYVICTVKLDEENPTFDGFAQENGFGSTKMHALMWLVKGAAACAPAETSVINMIINCCSVFLIGSS
jgi:hypothetical protein